MNNKVRTFAGALILSMMLTACTANTGVATETSVDPSSSDVTMPTTDLSNMTLEDVYGSQFPQYLNHQYYFEGQPVPMTESNFYFIDTYSELTKYAGYYYPATSEGFVDLSAAIDTTGMSEEMSQYSTYGDFFVAYSEQMLESALIINKKAADEGITLDPETSAQIDEMIANIETNSAAPAGLTLDEYLCLYYGEGTTAESLRQTICNYYLADQYTQAFIDSYDFDPADITVPNVRYALFQVEPGSTDEQRAEMEAAANEMFESAGGDVDIFTVDGAIAFSNGEVADYGEIGVKNDGSIDQTFTDWAWDESREEGDLDLIYSENFGYFIVAYLGTTEVDQSTKDQIAVQALSESVSEAIDNNEYEFYTDTPYEPAPTVAADESQLPQITDPSAASVESSSPIGSLTGNKGMDILLIVLSVVGAVAILGLAAVGINHLTKNKKTSGDKADKPSETEEE